MKVQKAMNLKIQSQLAEYDKKHLAEIDAMILWVLHERFGFGPKRLRRYYDSFRAAVDDLVKKWSNVQRPYFCKKMGFSALFHLPFLLWIWYTLFQR